MSLIYKFRNGGGLYHCGAHEIPSIVEREKIDLVLLGARSDQPEYINGCVLVHVPLDDTVYFTQDEFTSTVKDAKAAANQGIDAILKGKRVLSVLATL